VANVKRLGRGLEALLGRVGTVSPESELVIDTVNSGVAAAEERPVPMSNKIDLMKIEPNPFQPRRMFDEAELEQLSQSLITHGLLSPIALRRAGERYQIIAGERRFRAAIRAGWSDISAQIYEADDQQMAELALTENLQRKDLNAIEKAVSFANYLKSYGGTHEELAKRLEINRSTVTNLLRLLDLPQTLQDAICQEQISPGHARALFPLAEFEKVEIAKRIQTEGWSVRETEKFVQDLTLTGKAVLPKTNEGWNVVGEDGVPRTVSKQSEQVRQLEEEIRRFLGGAKVKLVQTNEKGKGKLVISFANHAEFEHVYSAVCRSNRAAG
jgi:ParB family chromosome partitioning protein